MIWLEMSRNPLHGGGSWGFTNCLWAPSRKENGTRWPFWEMLLDVKKNDTILHLRGARPPHFVGYSTAAENGYATNQRPPNPGQYRSFPDKFLRVPLTDFAPFKTPISLDDVFRQSDSQLREYYSQNRKLSAPEKRHIFYVIQSGRLQCLNGAYLSEVDSELIDILFKDHFGSKESDFNNELNKLDTGQQLRQIRTRIGQREFSQAVRANYGMQCCFPGCSISEEVFLVGAHIARWSDVPELRGDISNGVCLCLMHDKAFEAGLFTITQEHEIWVNQQKISQNKWAQTNLVPYHKHSMRRGEILPAKIPLSYHWDRINCIPE